MAGHQTRPPPKRWSPAVDIGIGLFLCMAAVLLFLYLADKEATGEGFTMHAGFVFLYRLGGKWLPCGLTSALGVTMLVVGVRRLLKPRK